MGHVVMENTIRIFEFLNYPVFLAYTILLFLTVSTFILPRKHPVLRVLAVAALAPFAEMVIFFRDPVNMVGALAIFLVYIILFHQGALLQKATAVLIFYPIVISVNYLQQNLSGELFFLLSDAPSDTGAWTVETLFFSSVIWHCSQWLRLLFWIGAHLFARRYKKQIQSAPVGKRLALIADAVMLIASVAVFTTQIFVAEYEYITYPLCAVVIVTGFCGIALVAWMSASEQTAREMEHMRIQHNYYLEKTKSEERVRSLYHDMKNHLLVLEGQGTDAAKQMARELRAQIADYEDYIHTGSPFLDIILRDKAEKARENHIAFSAAVDFGGMDFIEPLDISTLFGNGIDNALEASEKLSEERRVILVKAGRIQNFFSLLIENNCLQENQDINTGNVRGRTTKGDSFLHGFGIPNMKKAAEKYGGQMTARCENGKFTLKVLIPIP